MNIWTKPMVDRLRAEYSTCQSIEALAEELGVELTQAYNKAAKLRLTRSPERKLEAQRAGGIASKRYHVTPTVIRSESSTVAKAVASRSALEVAWGAQ